MKKIRQWIGFALFLATGMAFAGAVSERVTKSGTVRVCVWPDYYSITYKNPRDGRWSGIDIELSAEFARSLGARLQYVESSFASLIDDLNTDRCDIAMFAVGVIPQRQQKLAFSQPYLQSGIYGVTTITNRQVRAWADIDKPGTYVAVQAGTFMEPVMTESLKQAHMVVIRPPQNREQELEAGRVDVFMTDYPYSRRLLENSDWAKLVSPPTPFHPVPYAYAVKQGDAVWLQQVDSFVAAIKRDGRLGAAARRAALSEIALY